MLLERTFACQFSTIFFFFTIRWNLPASPIPWYNHRWLKSCKHKKARIQVVQVAQVPFPLLSTLTSIPLLQQLLWLPISYRTKYKTACMCYNAITGSAPSYLSEPLHLYSPSRSLRSSSDTRMLKIQRFNRKTHGFRIFSHFGSHIWNNLPHDIRHSATLSSLKNKLKTFLFLEYFS